MEKEVIEVVEESVNETVKKGHGKKFIVATAVTLGVAAGVAGIVACVKKHKSKKAQKATEKTEVVEEQPEVEEVK